LSRFFSRFFLFFFSFFVSTSQDQQFSGVGPTTRAIDQLIMSSDAHHHNNNHHHVHHLGGGGGGGRPPLPGPITIPVRSFSEGCDSARSNSSGDNTHDHSHNHNTSDSIRRSESADSADSRHGSGSINDQTLSNLANYAAASSKKVRPKIPHGASSVSNQTTGSYSDVRNRHRLPKRVILIRHGESLGNVDESAYTTIPDWKIPLTEKGEQQSREAGYRIKEIVGDDPLSIFCSPYLRTKQTLRHIMPALDDNLLINLREDPRLTEQQFGNFQSRTEMNTCKQERDKFGRFYYRFPQGESGLDVYNRVSSFIGSLWRDWEKDRAAPIEDTTVIVVTHGLTLRLFLMRWYQFSVTEFEDSKNPQNTAIVIMTRGDLASPTAASTGTSPRNANLRLKSSGEDWPPQDSALDMSPPQPSALNQYHMQPRKVSHSTFVIDDNTLAVMRLTEIMNRRNKLYSEIRSKLPAVCPNLQSAEKTASVTDAPLSVSSLPTPGAVSSPGDAAYSNHNISSYSPRFDDSNPVGLAGTDGLNETDYHSDSNELQFHVDDVDDRKGYEDENFRATLDEEEDGGAIMQSLHELASAALVSRTVLFKEVDAGFVAGSGVGAGI
jgi:broad specificity phosphatase PhoE